MNCECIYYSKDTGKDKYYMNSLYGLAGTIRDTACELYPVALSTITEDTKCFKDYYDFGTTVTIPKGSTVLFVGGKYHYMESVRIGRRVFHPYFPIDHDVQFEDIEDDETFNKVMTCESVVRYEDLNDPRI